jgi:D-glycero-alpha-D-manno-heptose-7-phosphate kinase
MPEMYIEDRDAFGAPVDEEWRNRKELATGVSTPVIESLLDAARGAGARSGKICGAGGGCLLRVSEPEAVPAVRSALAGAGARVLDFRIESHGLTVEHRVTA